MVNYNTTLKLFLKYNYDVDFCIGGKINENETEFEAIIRELKEEIDLDVDSLESKDFYPIYAFGATVVFLLVIYEQEIVNGIKKLGISDEDENNLQNISNQEDDISENALNNVEVNQAENIVIEEDEDEYIIDDSAEVIQTMKIPLIFEKNYDIKIRKNHDFRNLYKLCQSSFDVDQLLVLMYHLNEINNDKYKNELKNLLWNITERINDYRISRFNFRRSCYDLNLNKLYFCKYNGENKIVKDEEKTEAFYGWFKQNTKKKCQFFHNPKKSCRNGKNCTFSH
eukprot:TRINITY_DN15130_c0_g1_i1.p1 TRINITY_DN15130_c0_g1~~TRINITY_DN15130_c0_g1_i1.p1  ORF type:complete len:326 (-),score=49.27 TRINITY_DN15130_c0_g1_i1:136-984(-)